MNWKSYKERQGNESFMDNFAVDNSVLMQDIEVMRKLVDKGGSLSPKPPDPHINQPPQEN